MASTRIGVVGGGIVGLAVARRLGQVDPDAQLTVLEKESEVGRHQTGHNSGVAHAGVYYVPGSLKAKLCRQGIGMMKDFCAEHEITYDECGKLIVARDEGEISRLDELERRATENGVPGLKRIGPAEMAGIEPHVRGVSALHSPSTAIVDYPAVTRALADELITRGGHLRLGFEVAGITQTGGEIRVRSKASEEIVFDRLVACGGLQSDRLAMMAGEPAAPWIVPFRGEYYQLLPARRELVHALIYPVPDPAYPFLGVHFTKRVDGGVDIGPNAVLAFAREGYKRTDFNAKDLLDTLRSRGFQKLAMKHWKMGAQEMKGSFFKNAFLKDARTYIPELQSADVVAGSAGVRAQALDADGSLVDDFRIAEVGPIVLVRNAPSPAATSSLAIAEYVVEQVYRGSAESVAAAQ